MVELREWKLVKEGDKVTLFEEVGAAFGISLILPKEQMS